MKIRLGYVAMTLSLEDCSPSGSVTYATYEKLQSEQAKQHRRHKVCKKNLENTLRILKYNKAMNIQVYRLTSKLIPLATHPALCGWQYTEEFIDNFREIGLFIKQNDFRVSAHPDHFTLLNSPLEKVTEASLNDLDYHVRLFEAMGLEDYRYKLVLHVGGVYGNKKESLERFCANFTKLPDRIRNRLIIENDDRSYDTFDVLELCQKLNIPMVLDVHHHNCLCPNDPIENVLADVFDTWKNEFYLPIVHFSSPKSQKDYRSHADLIDFDAFSSFIQTASKLNKDFDVMLEAKSKDKALIKLSEELALLPYLERSGYGVFNIDVEKI